MKNIQFTCSMTDCESAAARLYLREIMHYPLLNEAEEYELSILIQKGDMKALNHLVTSNLRFVVSVAKHYYAQTLSLMDLVQEGNLGLMRAARLFKAGQGVRFMSYAVWHIREAIISAMAAKDSMLHRPKTQLRSQGVLLRFVQHFEQLYHRQPTTAEIAEGTGIAEYDCVSILDNTVNCASLDERIGYEEHADAQCCQYCQPSAVRSIDNDQLAETLRTALNGLNDQQHFVLASLYGVDGHPERTVDELAEELCLSPHRIREVARKALREIREHHALRLNPYL